MSTPDRDRRPFDLIVFGATSFVGQIVVSHLVERGDRSLRWAMAGRNATKLTEVAEAKLATVDRLVADAGDLDEMRALARRARG